MIKLDKNSKIYVAGHRGMVGSSVLRKLEHEGFNNIITKTRKDLDLLNTSAVENFFRKESFDAVIIAAAKVGGIQANIDSPADFLYENLALQNNILHSSYLTKVKRVCFLGSSCIYPRECRQPMKESYLMDGKLEPTNEGYALAKISGMKLAEFITEQYGISTYSLMPCNLYGTNDNYDPNKSHVLAALIKKIYDAKDKKSSKVAIWGTGNARREFMHVDDIADAIFYFLNYKIESTFINIGWGEDVSIRELSILIANEIGYKGQLEFDLSKPDGMMKKCLDVTKMKELGFFPKIDLMTGIRKSILEYSNIKIKG
jgi:GDP-L-fucose synthase